MPIVTEIPARLKDFLTFLKSSTELYLPDEEFNDLNLKETQSKLQSAFIYDVAWLINSVENHASIDTFAKKLYFTGKRVELRKLKIITTFFFIYEQVIKNADPRYDSFFASILNTKERGSPLPNNLKILSWNYDFQFEKSYSAYSLNNNLKANQINLNIYPADVSSYDYNKFSILKLNGTTSIHESQWRNISNILSECTMEIDINFIEVMIRAYAGVIYFPQLYEPLLKFAWEENEISERTLDFATNCSKSTDVLVVIGYSFPFFNREIDRKIIRGMTNLKKVYFQAPGEEARKYIDRFRSIIPDVEKLKPEPISDVYQFFLPPEL